MDKYTYEGLYLDGFSKLYDLADKRKSHQNYMTYMLARTARLFKWEGLPDTIPQRELELMLQSRGHVGIAKVKNDLYALNGSFGGMPDAYYRPTIYTVSNPALKISKSFDINKNIIIAKSDSMYMGLAPLFSRYCTQLVENDLTLLLADINSRMPYILTVDNDGAKLSGEKLLADIKDGHMGVLCDEQLFESVNTLSYGGNVYGLSDLIEYEQYLKASMFNDIGLDANYNMKREAINTAEAQMNDDALLPLIDDMLKCRQETCEKINEMFGTEISVDFDSIWKIKEIEDELALEILENNAENAHDDSNSDVEEPTNGEPEYESGEDNGNNKEE